MNLVQQTRFANGDIIDFSALSGGVSGAAPFVPVTPPTGPGAGLGAAGGSSQTVSSFVNIRREIVQLRASDPLISRALDVLQNYANVNDARWRTIPIRVDRAGNLQMAANTIQLFGAGLLVEWLLGKLGIGTSGPPTVSGTGVLHVGGNTTRIVDSLRTLSSSSDTGYVGELAISSGQDFLYVCVASGPPSIWKRIPLTAF